MKKETNKSVKEKREKTRAILNMLPGIQNIDVRAELIQTLTPMGLLYAQGLFEDELTQLVGNRYQRNSGSNYYRWGRHLKRMS